MTSAYNPEVLSSTIGAIYDCAVDPTRWEHALSLIRDQMGLAYVQIIHQDFRQAASGAPPTQTTLGTEWDQVWIDRLPPLMHIMPGFDVWMKADLDTPISQMQIIEERDFRLSEFCRSWVAPQNLRDTCNTAILQRDGQVAWLVATSPQSRRLFSDGDRKMLRLLAPHVRRTFLIADMASEQQRQLQLYREMLDSMNTAVFLLDTQARVHYHNAAAEKVLTATNCFVFRNGCIQPHSVHRRKAFSDALARAGFEAELDLGGWGSGMPLPDADGETAVAYLLPLRRSDRRRAMGPGSIAMFVSTSKTARPPSVEVLSALSGLTTAEARIALAIADGETTESIASRLAISIHTLRKHLSNTFDKTGLANQAALGAWVNRMRL